MKPRPHVGGAFIPDAVTDEQWDMARANVEKLGLTRVFLIGERADGTTGVVTVNMASINHLAEVGDRALNALPTW